MILKLDRLCCLVLLLLFIPAIALAQEQNHIVKRGDTLYGIGRKYGMTVREIQDLNQLQSTNLAIGQVLKVRIAEPSEDPATPAPEALVTEAPQSSQTSPTPAAEPTLEPESPPEPAPAFQRSSLPSDYFYKVQRGDNLFRIAKNHEISFQNILKWNGFESSEVSIYPGQRVIIKDPYKAGERSIDNEADPTVNEIKPQIPVAPTPTGDTEIIEKVYIVQPKDTLFKIARENNMTVDEIKRINTLLSNDIRVGQKIYLAGNPRAASSTSPGTAITEADIINKDKIREDLVMPVEGKILSEYGLRNGRPHKGIDLGAKSGTPIFAVLDGTVVYSGVQGAYGNVVVLEHPDFVMTVYAHNEKNLVAVGDTVQKGQQIAMVGSTGNATGSHLHFEYRIKGKAINPRKVLPLDKG